LRDNQPMKFRCCLLVFAAVTTGCASTHVEYKTRYGLVEWRKGLEERKIKNQDLVYPFDVTPELEAWAKNAVVGFHSTQRMARLDQLQSALLDPDAFNFTYEEATTLTASEAFSRRRGNCMAFTALFVTASRAIGLDTFLVSVQRMPSSKKSDDLIVVNHHVAAGYFDVSRLIVYDFYKANREPGLRYNVIDDVEATAYYHNNRGGAAIRQDDYATAVHQLELATTLIPDLVPAWVNLGVARNRLGDTDGAIKAYIRALELAPGYASALTNLAYIYIRQGKQDEAQAALQAASEHQTTPFSLIALADAEIARGNLVLARKHLNRARRLGRDVPDVYDAFARLAERKGKQAASQKYHRQAEELREAAEQLQPEQVVTDDAS